MQKSFQMMITRISGFFFAFLLIPIFSQPAFAKSSSYIDPASGVTIPVPAGWNAMPGFGDTISVMRDGDGSSIHAIDLADRKSLEGVVRRLYPGASLGRKGDDTISFERSGDVHLKGVAIQANKRGCEFAAICSGKPDRFADIYLSCREAVKGVGCQAATVVKPRCVISDPSLADIPSPSSIYGMKSPIAGCRLDSEEAFRMVLSKGLFALFDDRLNCPGISRDAVTLSESLRRSGDTMRSSILNALSSLLSSPVDGGRVKKNVVVLKGGVEGNLRLMLEAFVLETRGREASAEEIYIALRDGADGFFPALRLATIYLARGDVEGALGMLRKVRGVGKGKSHLLTSLEIELAGMHGENDLATRLFESSAYEACGVHGSRAAYRLGLAVGTDDAKRAMDLFAMSIDADPTNVAAYLSFGRALADDGVPADVAAKRMSDLMRLAPNTPSIMDVRRKLDGYLMDD